MSRPLGAQRPLSVDVGLTGAHFVDDDANVFGPSIHLAISGRKGRLFGSAEGGSIATLGAASGFATLEGGVRSSVARGWSTELAGELGTVAGSNTSGGAGTAIGHGRLTWSAGNAGAWLRASTHASGRTHGALTGRGLETGAWWTGPRTQLSATLTQEWTTAELFVGRFREQFAGTTPVRYAEAAVSLHAESDRATLDLSAGARRDVDAAHLYEPALSATAALWTGEKVAVVFSVARQLPDWVRGADAADAFSVGMRFRQATPASDRAARLIPVVQVIDSAGVRVLRVRASGASQVEVMGDFTNWEAQPLSRSGAVFERAVTLSSGSHRLVLRIDGGEWRTAANTPAVDDDLGGKAGLLVVP
ncbi:MAG: glycogen-binding domain-containing protein [bacterium]